MVDASIGAYVPLVTALHALLKAAKVRL